MACWQWTGAAFERRSFRNAWAGAEAIVVCPGPSLAEAADLLAPRRRPAAALVIGVNTSWPTVRPDLWFGGDHPECYLEGLMQCSFPKFLGNAYAELPWLGRLVKEWPATYFLDRDKRQGVDLPTNMFVAERLGEHPAFVWGWSLWTAMHLACWFGCRRTYLVGVDLNVAPGEVQVLAGTEPVPDGSDGAAEYHDGRHLEGRLARINRTGMQLQLAWMARMRAAAARWGYELIVTGEDSAVRRYLPYVPLAEALDRIERRASGRAMVATTDSRVHALLANQAGWGKLPAEPFGIVTGADRNVEWRLPWWTECVRRHYAGPLAFANFGMSDGALEFCSRHGRVVPISGTYVPGWWNKPIAILRAGFARTVWIDTDAEVCGDLSQLRGLDLGAAGYALAIDRANCFDAGLDRRNTGVVVTDWGCEAIRQWGRQCLLDPSRARGDQELLNRLVDDHLLAPAAVLPRQYNALRLQAWDGSERICHWTGSAGDGWIRRTCTSLRGRGGELLRRIPADQPAVGAEIGVLDGRTSRLLMQRRPLLTWYIVDAWGPHERGLSRLQTLEVAERACRQALMATGFAGDRRRVLRGDSAAMAAEVADGSLDICFIDADHSYEGCLADLRAWSAKVRPGGILGGHDYANPAFPHWGVPRAVREWMAEAGIDADELVLGGDLTWWVTIPIVARGPKRRPRRKRAAAGEKRVRHKPAE